MTNNAFIKSESMISLGYYCSIRHFFTTYCFNSACVDRTTPTYCKILPIILGIILNSLVHLLFSKLCWNNLSSLSVVPSAMLPFPTASPEMLVQSSHREWDRHSTAGSCGTIIDLINVSGYTASCVQWKASCGYIVLLCTPLSSSSHFILLPLQLTRYS